MRRRAVGGLVLLATWLAFLTGLATGDNVCFDPATKLTGIDALGHCASHHPLGLPVTIPDDVPIASFIVVPAALAALWWPWRPWRS
jgi:hypothetical protein